METTVYLSDTHRRVLIYFILLRDKPYAYYAPVGLWSPKFILENFDTPASELLNISLARKHLFGIFELRKNCEARHERGIEF